MHFRNKNIASDGQLMMALSSVGYMPSNSLSTLQINLDGVKFLDQAFTAIWWAKIDSVFVFLVKNKSAEEYTLVLRGAVFRFGLTVLLNLYEDLDIAHQVSLPYSRLGGAKIAAGVVRLIQKINNLTYAGKTLQQVIKRFPFRAKLYVTGHSLGGSLASVYAAQAVCNNSGELEFIPFTFGAPSVGNKHFADLFDSIHVNCLFTQSTRCENIEDLIPRLWSNLPGVVNIDYGKITCPDEFRLCADFMERLLINSRVFYAQPPPQLRLKTENERYETFFSEAMYQHQPNTYLTSLGLSPINIDAFSEKERKEVAQINSL